MSNPTWHKFLHSSGLLGVVFTIDCIFRFMNKIHPTAIIGPEVVMGVGNVIEAYAVIQGRTQIGDSNWIGPHVVIGTPPESRQHHNPENNLTGEVTGKVLIGSKCVIHEHSAIQSPTEEITLIGDEVFLMHAVHVGHDCKVSNGVTIAPTSVLAGHVCVGKNATLGIGVVVHQFVKIGGLSMIGMNSTVVKDVKPFSLFVGSPARFVSLNEVGLIRAGFSLDSIKLLVGEPWEDWNLASFPSDVARFLQDED